MTPWRHARAIALLPGIAAVLAPTLILIGEGTGIGCGLDGVLAAVPVAVGLMPITAGFALWVWTVRLLAEIGEGTLASTACTDAMCLAGSRGARPGRRSTRSGPSCDRHPAGTYGQLASEAR